RLAEREGAAADPDPEVVDDPPPPTWPEVVAICGTDGVGVPADQPGLASAEWLVLLEVARWLERASAAGFDDRQVPARLEHVTSGSLFPLPPPSSDDLPRARSRQAPRASQFVSIGAQLRVGALSQARLRGGHLELLAVPGTYPGQVVDDQQLGAVLAQHGDMLTQLTGRTPPAAPLIVAAADVRLQRVLDVVTRLGAPQAEIAVAGPTAAAHPVVLERKAMQVGAPVIALGVDRIAIRGFGDDRVTDHAGLATELDHFAAVNAPVRALELHAHAGATLAELVALMDACWQARVEALVFVPGAPPGPDDPAAPAPAPPPAP
ncbi:MAG: hypothetical protein KC464_34070, partial [Myxococcales bacterium]|nr:hypothetical protein [Myxococcales bacterium]